MPRSITTTLPLSATRDDALCANCCKLARSKHSGCTAQFAGPVQELSNKVPRSVHNNKPIGMGEDAVAARAELLSLEKRYRTEPVACVQIVAGFLPPKISRTRCHRLQLGDEAAAAAVAVFPDEEVMQMVPGIVINNGEAWRIDEEDGSLYCWRWRQSECVWEANTAVAKSKLPMLASDDDDVCYGLFAMREFAAGETVGYYDGTIIGTCEQLDYSDWLPLYLKDHDKV
eukprot:3447-Heterococcus_DN1.PRE.1